MLEDEYEDSLGQSVIDYQILVGDQEDRVCTCRNEECRPKDNADFIAASRNFLTPETIRELIRVLESRGDA